jgi:ornithine carbamoyltransferase
MNVHPDASASAVVQQIADRLDGARGHRLCVRWVPRGRATLDVHDLVDEAVRRGFEVRVVHPKGACLADERWEAADDAAVCWGGRLRADHAPDLADDDEIVLAMNWGSAVAEGWALSEVPQATKAVVALGVDVPVAAEDPRRWSPA